MSENVTGLDSGLQPGLEASGEVVRGRRLRRVFGGRLGRWLARAFVAGVVLVGGTLFVRHSVAEVYRIPVGSLEPELPKDCRVLVYKLGEARVGDIVAYRHSATQDYVGRVDDVTADGLVVSRNGVHGIAVESTDVIGRVVAGTR